MKPYANPRLPLWCRVYLFAQVHHGKRLDRGELRESLGAYTSADVSRAIRTAERMGLLAHDSTARCLYVKHKVEVTA